MQNIVEEISGLGFEKTTPHLPASSHIYETLRHRIITFDLPPGERLSRPELADLFGVSASPLREALQRLERDGLVKTFRQSRTVVSHMDPRQMKQEHFLRTALECEVVNTLAQLVDKSAMKKVAAILRMQKVLVDDLDQIGMFRKLDEDFHRELFDAAGQVALHQIVKEGTNQIARLRTLDLPSEGKLASVVTLHEKVLDAIMSGDRIAATEAMRLHLSGTISRLDDIMAQYPDYFIVP